MKWISVKDRIPSIQNEYLITDMKDIEIRMWWDNGLFGVGFEEGFPVFKVKCVTHWMPLPELPEDGTYKIPIDSVTEKSGEK